jgi:hypothetical protein
MTGVSVITKTNTILRSIINWDFIDLLSMRKQLPLSLAILEKLIFLWPILWSICGNQFTDLRPE